MPVPFAAARFDLSFLLGRGGMGEVWSATAADGTRVAIKVLTAASAMKPAAVAAFAEEARAVARLDHRGIVGVFDQGVVDREMAASSGGRVVEGMPFLAMELASGGTLADRRVGDWATLRELLGFLLEALAHAHARGVLHRDLKPENILVCDEADARPGPKIADFGIASAVGGSARAQAGTPGFMAPEQRRDDIAQGPWTDLYAFGVLARQLVSTTGPGQQLRPRFPVPAGLDAWLTKLVAPNPAARFRRAADAAWALLQVDGDPVEPDPDDRSEPSGSAATIGFDGETDEVPTASALGWLAADRVPPSWLAWRDLVPTGAVPPVPPLVDPPRHAVDLVGAGVGLLHARVVPFVGRRAEREQLWSELAAARAEARAVSIRGTPGIGRTRLLVEVAELAEELGPAAAFVVRCLPGDGPTDAVARLARALLPRVSPPGLADVAAGRAEAFDKASARYACVAEALQALDRLAVIGLDDAQFGSDAVGLAEHLLAAGLPCLVIATTDAAEPRPGWRDVALGPLTDMEQRGLVERILGLDGVLAAIVAQRAGGHPGLAVRLVATWAAQGQLVPTPRGLALAPGVDPWASGDWDPEALDPAALDALERAAAGGTDVDEADWALACAVDGLDPAPATSALVALARRRLVELGRGGFAFAGGVHAALEARARREGRWAGHHRAWATVVDATTSPSRAGLHLIEAGDVDVGIPLAIAAIGERAGSVPPDVAIALTVRCEHALRRDGREPGPTLAAVLVVRADMLRVVGRNDEAIESAERAVLLAGDHWEIERRARFRAALCYRDALDLPRATAHAERLLALSQRTGDPGCEARGALVMGRLAMNANDSAGGRRWFERALAAFERAGEDVWVADLHCELGVQRGGPEGEALVRKALSLHERAGRISGQADAWSALAYHSVEQGDHEAAIGHYHRAEALFVRTGAQSWLALQQIHRGQSELVLGRPERAREPVEAARAYFERRPWPWIDILCRMCACALAAADRDWPAWDEAFASLPARPEDQGDHFAALLAARYAEQAGDPLRAAAAREFAARWTDTDGVGAP